MLGKFSRRLHYSCWRAHDNWNRIWLSPGTNLLRQRGFFTMLLMFTRMQSPWGRTSTSEFQVTLAEKFHNVLAVQLPSFPFGRDYLSVWKRTEFVDIDEEDYSRSKSVSEGNESEEPVADTWADIPNEERIVDFAAPAFRHLLK